ncbi:hypothetical protein [Pseudomonas sp. NPDC088444]|uniref:hypothetical protein n=1 Tax=Pseudomonas sp. NPDC088444 TaxID=3364456 RepID=UPI00384A999E
MSFSLDLKAFVEKAKANAETVVKKVSLDLAYSVIDRSPVGNPELWAANMAYRAKNKAEADAYDAHVEVRNVITALTPSNFTRNGNLKRGVKYAKPLTKAERVQNFDVNGLVSGKGYVGGRFRGNWQVSFDAPITTTIDRVDGKSSETSNAAAEVIYKFDAGVGTIWIMNNLPYGHRLEYEAWSKQAPAGMVRRSVTELQTYINNAVSGLDK